MVLPLLPLAVGSAIASGAVGVGWLYKKRLDSKNAESQAIIEKEREDSRQAQIIATAPSYAQDTLRGATASSNGIDWTKIALGVVVVAGVAFIAYGALRK